MTVDGYVRRKMARLLAGYLAGTATLSEILSFEAEWLADDRLGDQTADDLSWLSLRGHEVLMDLRPRASFDEAAREVLARSLPGRSAGAAAG